MSARVDSLADGLPGAVERALVALLVAAAAFGLVGVMLAVAGAFRPWTVGPLGGLVTAVALVAWDLRRPVLDAAAHDSTEVDGALIEGAGALAGGPPGDGATGSRPPRAHGRRLALAWSLAVLVAVGATALNAAWANEHVVMDRDPAVYLNAAEWLRTTGGLQITQDDGPFAGDGALTLMSPGLTKDIDGRPVFQNLHLLPVWAAGAGWLAGDNAMARVPAGIAGLMLLVVFALGARVMRAGAALAGTALLAVLFPFVYFARDFYSEWALGLLALGGAWLLDAAVAARSPRRAAVAGFVVGAAAVSRIDSILTLAGFVLFLGLRSARRHARPIPDREPGAGAPDGQWRRLVLAFAVPALAGLGVMILDGKLRSTDYLRAHAGDLRTQAGVMIGVGAVVAGVLALRRWAPRTAAALVSRRRLLAGLAAGAVVVLALGLAFVRPRVQVARDLRDATLTRLIQQREGQPVDGRRSYAERSFLWLAWYLGPALGLAVAGAAWAVFDAVRGRLGRSGLLVLYLVPVPLLSYLARPSIYPDQPWAMRRFLPVALPALCLLVGYVADRLWSAGSAARGGAWTSPVLRASAVAVVAVAFVQPLAVLRPLRETRSHTDEIGLLRQVCRELPGNAAVLVVTSPGVFRADTFVQPVRGFCRIPAAGVAGSGIDIAAADVARLAAQWARRNRQLWVLGGSDDALRALGAVPRVRAARTDTRTLAYAISRRPAQLRPSILAFVAGPVLAVP